MSMTLLEQMKSSISQQSIGYAAKLLGESSANIENAVSLAVPMILSAITSAAHTPSGAAGQSVVSRLVGDPVNDGSLLHRLPALYQGTMTASPVYRLGAQLLQAIFGTKLGKATQTIAALSGIKPASSALLVNTLAPHVLSVLGKRHRLCGDATPHGLINLLDTEHAAIQAAIPGSLAELIPAPVKVATADAITATNKPALQSTVTKTAAAAGAKPAAGAKTAAASGAKPAAAAKTTAVQPAHTTVPKRDPHVKPPLVTKQSYQWSSWLPVIALYGAGAAGLAMFLTSQTEAPTGTIGVTAPAETKTAATPTAPAAKPASVVATPLAGKPADTKPAEIKTAEVKPAGDVKPSPAKAPEVKTTEVKTTEVKTPDVKPADSKTVTKQPGVSAAPPVKTAEAAKPAAAPPVVSKPATATAAAAEDVAAQANPYKAPVTVIRPGAEAAKSSEPAKTAALQPAAGATSYYGTSASPVADTAAKMNPDYKPAQPAAQAAAAASPAEKPAALPAPKPPAGTTSYFGTTPVPADSAAKMNPDYKPATAPEPAPAAAPAKTADAIAPVTAPAQTTIVVQPPPAKGTTTFFGATPPVAEAPAKANPDYKPAPAPVAEAVATPPPTAVAPKPAQPAPVATAAPPAPSLATQALSVVKSLIAPAPARPPGVTNYFGTTPPVPEAAARANPDYVPAKPATGDATPPSSATAKASATPGATTAKPAIAGDTTAAGLCRASIAKAMKGGRIAFQSAKADLRNSSAALLDRVAEAFKTCPGVRLTIEGHTDNTGQAEMNQKLSLARAQTVTSYLTSKGVDAARVTPAGVGSARPVAPNTTIANKARNRRIEFTVNNS